MADKTVSQKYRENVEQKAQLGQSKYQALKAANRKGGMTWDSVSADALHTAVASVTEDGAALLLSKTSDGGALVIRVIADPGGDSWFPSSAMQAEEDLKQIAETANKP